MIKKTAKHLFCAVLLLSLVFGIGCKTDVCAAGWKFGDQLTGREKELYMLLEENCSTLQNYKVVNGITLQFDRPMTETEGTTLEWFRIQRAFLLDHSELFWIRFLSMSLIMKWNAAAGNYSASDMVVYSVDRYQNIRNEIKSADKEINKAIRAVKKSKGRYAKVKVAHDYVIRLTTYPKNLTPEYYHAVTGPLLKKYAHRGVCEAYAWLFDILCKANGIPCVVLEGDNHAWNYVQMEDGKWYLVDTTWDDGKKISYDYFLVGSGTTVDGKKVKRTHNVDSTKELYRLNNVASLKYPTLSKQAYKKNSNKKKVTSVRIRSSVRQVKAGKKLVLKATVLPEGAENKKLRWISSNTKYATVTGKGVVKAKKAGRGKTVRITAKATDGSGRKATIRIKIR